MDNLWNDSETSSFKDDLLRLRVYSSRLLGKESSLVLHGGGNTSVKMQAKNIFGEYEDLLYVKGSGWDLATIEPQGFSPARMSHLLKLSKLQSLSDTEMVREQRVALTSPDAPNASVEAILHAIIPYTFVDHTHADAVVTVSNTPNGPENIKEIYGNSVLVVPYVMPGFILAKTVADLTKGIDWSKYEGMILMHHGIFTFADDAKTSYSRMIKLVSKAEDFIASKKAFKLSATKDQPKEDLLSLAKLRKQVSKAAKSAFVAKLNSSPEALTYVNKENLSSFALRGPLTPDHVLYTKPVPMIFTNDAESDVQNYVKDYQNYFTKNTDGKLTCLDPAPRWVLWPNHGMIALGQTEKKASIVNDLAEHTIKSIQWAESLGGWRALPEKNLFEVEYWELEQAKLKKGGSAPALQGKVALVTGAASGIGRACAENLLSQGAAVVALDIDSKIKETFKSSSFLGIVCDVTKSEQINEAIKQAVRTFGGLDIVVSNAGTFPASKTIAELDDENWKKSMDVNLSSHHYLLRAAIPYLCEGIDPTIIIIASKNVPAPGPGAAAYSAAKAGLTQLARVAALELAPKGVRVNILHPNAVFDTGIWSNDVLEKRAKQYGLSVQDYKTNNLMKVEITSKNVAELVCSMAGSAFSKVTGAQIPIDGGNDRVI